MEHRWPGSGYSVLPFEASKRHLPNHRGFFLNPATRSGSRLQLLNISMKQRPVARAQSRKKDIHCIYAGASKVQPGKLAVGYVRIGHVDPTSSQFTAEQHAAIRTYAATAHLVLVGVFLDIGYSAEDRNRPGVRALLQFVRGGGARFVIVINFERLFRSFATRREIADALTKSGARVISTYEYSASFGADASDVAQWQQRAEEIVARLPSRSSAPSRHHQPASPPTVPRPPDTH